jgi:F0F1-type ATP synthase assembly protein I
MMPERKPNLPPKSDLAENADQQGHPQSPQQGASGMGLLAQVSTLAWNLVIPIVGGVLLGEYLDKRNGSGVTWTMSLLVMGVIIAFSNLYNLYMEHGYGPAKNTKDNDKVKHDQEA